MLPDRSVSGIYAYGCLPPEIRGEDASDCPPCQKHLVLEIELPDFYVEHIPKLVEEFRGAFESESDTILNCIGEPGVVRLRTEISGEKDSDVVEVWGHVRSAKLVEASRGYGKGAHLTGEQLAENGWKLMREERCCEWCAVNVESRTVGDDS